MDHTFPFSPPLHPAPQVPAKVHAATTTCACATPVTKPWIAPNASAFLDVLGVTLPTATTKPTTTLNVPPMVFATVKRGNAPATMVLPATPAATPRAPMTATATARVNSSANSLLMDPSNTVRSRIVNTSCGMPKNPVLANVMLTGVVSIARHACAPKGTIL